MRTFIFSTFQERKGLVNMTNAKVYEIVNNTPELFMGMNWVSNSNKGSRSEVFTKLHKLGVVSDDTYSEYFGFYHENDSVAIYEI